ASARAPAFGVYASASAAASTRRRTSSEMGRLPDSAYDAVLRLTPASRATSPIVATLTSWLLNRFDGCVALLPRHRCPGAALVLGVGTEGSAVRRKLANRFNDVG